MRKLIFSIILVSLACFAQAAPRIKAIRNGSWGHSATWNLARVPAALDTIEIPNGVIISITSDKTFSAPIYLIVAGTIDFLNNSTTLQIPDGSTIVVSGGTISGNGNPSQRIKMGNVSVFKGSDPDITGYQLLNSSTGGFVATGNSTLPVRFNSFTVAKTAGGVLVAWGTSMEQNALHFQVERSKDGRNWSVIATVAAAGFSSTLQQYSYADRSATGGKFFYRIRQVDTNGAFAYTSVREVAVEGAGVRIMANAGRIVLQFDQAMTAKTQVRIVNFNGQVVSEQQLTSAAGQVVLPTSLKGQFIVSVSTAAGLQQSGQVML